MSTTKTTSRTFDGVRNRAQRGYFGHLGMLGHDPAMPRQTVQVVASRHRGGAGVSTVRRPGHVVSDPGISRRRARAYRLRLPIGTCTVASLVIIIPALIGGWYLCRDRVAAIAEQRRGFTGEFPVIAARPLADSHRPILD